MGKIELIPILGVLLFVVLSTSVAKALVFLFAPVTYGGRGILNLGRSFENYLSMTVNFFCLPKLSLYELIKLIFVLSLLTMAFLMIPLFSDAVLVSVSPLVIFLLVFFVARFIWAFSFNFYTQSRSLKAKDENFLVSSMCWLIFISTILFVFREQEPLSKNNNMGLLGLSMSATLYFCVLFLFSRLFIFSQEKAMSLGYAKIVFSFSHCLWFLFFSWVFIGSISESSLVNVFFYFCIVSLMMALHEVASGFLPKMSERLRERIEEITVVPVLLVSSILVCLEVVLL